MDSMKIGIDGFPIFALSTFSTFFLLSFLSGIYPTPSPARSARKVPFLRRNVCVDKYQEQSRNYNVYKQCDQMTKWSFQYWTINNSENLSYIITFVQLGSKFCPIQNKPS